MHCHGVFDLLHVGHIRHFKQARKYGDVLVVTITPDKYVNKGPHRPTFNEKLRAEVLAALDLIDYVAVNKWPAAVETIKLLKPNFYVKGVEYENVENDLSGKILDEERAIKEVGGEIIFTQDITFSSTALINRYLHAFPKETEDFLMDFSKKYTSKQVISYLEQLKDLKILIIGEAIIDEYQYGHAIGKAGFIQPNENSVFDYREFAKTKPNISFTPEEEEQGKKLLRKIGVPEGAWFVFIPVILSIYRKSFLRGLIFTNIGIVKLRTT